MRISPSVKVFMLIGAGAEVVSTVAMAQVSNPDLTPSPFAVYATTTTSSVSTGGGNTVEVPATNYDRPGYLVHYGHPDAFATGVTAALTVGTRK